MAKKSLNGWMRLWIGISSLWIGLWVALGITVSMTATNPNFDYTDMTPTLLVTLAPPAVLFGLGHFVAWIRRGFSHD